MLWEIVHRVESVGVPGPSARGLSRRSPASSDDEHWSSHLRKTSQLHHHFRFPDIPPLKGSTVKMGIMEYMEDLYASLTWHEAEAEAPASGMCSLPFQEFERDIEEEAEIMHKRAECERVLVS